MTQNVMIVEDDEITRFMMSEMLEEIGAPFTLHGDGKDCVDSLTTAPGNYALILMDLHMPGMSGLQAISEIRSADANPPREIPVFAVTADEGWHSDHKARDVGFDGVLPKPVRMNDLRNLIQRYVVT